MGGFQSHYALVGIPAFLFRCSRSLLHGLAAPPVTSSVFIWWLWCGRASRSWPAWNTPKTHILSFKSELYALGHCDIHDIQATQVLEAKAVLLNQLGA